MDQVMRLGCRLCVGAAVVLCSSAAVAPTPAQPAEISTTTSAREIAAWGSNQLGQLGAGYKGGIGPAPGPVTVAAVHEAVQVAASYHFSMALLRGGSVVTWGGNDQGELGDGTDDPSLKPVAVSGLSGVTAIAAGGAHAMALLSNGTVATWGGNGYGTAGNGTASPYLEGVGDTTPIVVPGLSGVVAIAAGGADDAALLSNGTVETWGEDKGGQLGNGTVTLDVPWPVLVSGLRGVKAIAVGGVGSLGGHMLALLANGTVMAWGNNASGQLGTGTVTRESSTPVPVTGLSGVATISASISHNLALMDDGTVRSWGGDADGELGVAAPELCGLVNADEPCSAKPVPVPGLSGVTSVSAGFNFSLAVSRATVSAWGLNDAGQLGDGSLANSAVPVPVGHLRSVSSVSAGEFHSLALLAGDLPPPELEAIAGAGSLALSWRWASTTNPWVVNWRPVTDPAVPFGSAVTLAPAARSYTVTGLAGMPYEVQLRNRDFGRRVVVATPQAPG